MNLYLSGFATPILIHTLFCIYTYLELTPNKIRDWIVAKLVTFIMLFATKKFRKRVTAALIEGLERRDNDERQADSSSM